MLAPADLFDLEGHRHPQLFDVEFVWEVLKRIKSHIRETIEPNVDEIRNRGDVLPQTVVMHHGKIIDSGFSIASGSVGKGQMVVKHDHEQLEGATVVYAGSSLLSSDIQLGQGSIIEPGALLKAGCIIGDMTEVRQGAYLRGDCLIGDRCVVGHTTEAKNALLLDDAKAGHFAYIGDSVLGHNVNLGAGTKLANLKLTGSGVVLRVDKQTYNTGLRKFGAIIGDDVETGCNSVTSPGTILGQGAMVFPNATVRPGYYRPRTLVK